jgi:hypothetical protein
VEMAGARNQTGRQKKLTEVIHRCCRIKIVTYLKFRFMVPCIVFLCIYTQNVQKDAKLLS